MGTTGKTAVLNIVRFELPSLPGSVNEIYQPGYAIYSSKPVWRLKPEWALWSSKMMPYISTFKKAANSLVRVDRRYYYPFFYKNGNWRKVDSANMDKLLFDTISKKTGINDLFFKQGEFDSRDSQSGKVKVALVEITEDVWRALD